MQIKTLLRKISLILITSCTLFFLLPGQAASTNQDTYSPEAWSKIIDTINAQLTGTAWTVTNTTTAIQTIQTLQTKANACVKDLQANLDNLDTTINTLNAGAPTPDKITTKNIPETLDKKRLELNYTKIECQFFLLNSKKVLAALDNIQQNLYAHALFSRDLSLLSNIKTTATDEKFFQSFNTASFLKQLGYEDFDKLTFTLFTLLTIFSIIMSYLSSQVLSKKITRLLPQTYITSLFLILKKYIYWLVFTLSYAIFFAFYSEPNFSVGLANISAALLAFIILKMLIEILFDTSKFFKPLILANTNMAEKLATRLITALIFIFVSYSMVVLFKDQPYPTSFSSVLTTSFVTLFSILILWIVFSLTLPLKAKRNVLRNTINIASTFILIGIIFLDWMGYVKFSHFLLENIFIFLALSFLAGTLNSVLSQSLLYLFSRQKVRYYLGIFSNKEIFEVYILKAVIFTLLWCGFVLAIVKLCFFSDVYFYSLLNDINNGFYIANLHIVPIRLLFAVMVFLTLSLCNRFMQATISRHNKLYSQEGAQVALATVAGYAGFSAAIILSLVIAGINFTNLAIIVGALSVGIGFGLQNIINNFISGLILLLESPIRAGDRIMVGDVEGFVRRISLRATHVVTSRGADVFIPNADLIAKNVTNYQYLNSRWLIICKVSVAYDSNVDLVKETLLDIANKHPQIIQDAPNQPQVFISQLGDSGILFSLVIMILNVNQKSQVESDIYTAIIKTFAKLNISLPFPQQDIFIKNFPENLLQDPLPQQENKTQD